MASARAVFTYDGQGVWMSRDGEIILQNPADPDPGPDPAPAFILGTTRPTKANTGPDLTQGTLDPYTGPNAGGQLTLSTAGAVYEGIDFGATNTRVRRAANDIEIRNCSFVNKSRATYSADPGPMIDCRSGSSYGGCHIYRCSFDNQHQWSSVVQAVMGYGFTVERCWSENFQDNFGVYVSSAAQTNLDVEILGSWLGPLSWWYSPTGGQVHSSDTKSHNDNIQWQGGQGLRVEGNDIYGVYSTTIGTGTPNSGNDTTGLGASAAPYTQAAGVAKRFEIVDGSGAFGDGKLGAHLGGSISALMFTPVGRGSTPAAVIKNNWGRGGSYWLNAGAAVADSAGVTWTFDVTGNRIVNDQRIAGRAVVINSVVSKVQMPTTGPDVNTWADGSGVITRRTG